MIDAGLRQLILPFEVSMFVVALGVAIYAWRRGVRDLGGIPDWLVWVLGAQLFVALTVSVITGLWLGALALTVMLATLLKVYF